MHVSPKPLSDYPWPVRWIFRGQIRKYGEALMSARLWARSTRVFLALSSLYGAFDRKSSPLAPALRSLVLVRISQINHCAFCIDLNSSISLERGADREKLEALGNWRQSSLLDAFERDVLDYAEAITHTDGEVRDELITRLKQHLDEDGLVELTGLIAFQNMSTKFNNALDVPPQGFCQVPALIAEEDVTRV